MSSEYEENQREERRIEDDRRDSAIEIISALYPPDSDYTDTRALGREDVISALCECWRALPVDVLEHMARVQHRRDHSL
jgi:hypothetical protein